jgi:hypothetical protein
MRTRGTIEHLFGTSYVAYGLASASLNLTIIEKKR